VKCRGFLFDLDGTLVDSLPVVERAWSKWAQRLQLSEQEVLDFIHGKQAITSLRHFLPDASEETLQQEFLWLETLESKDTDGIVALPGALALLNHLNEANIPWAIVTSGSIPVATARHAAAGLPEPGIFVTSEQVARGKPEPDAAWSDGKRYQTQRHFYPPDLETLSALQQYQLSEPGCVMVQKRQHL